MNRNAHRLMAITSMVAASSWLAAWAGEAPLPGNGTPAQPVEATAPTAEPTAAPAVAPIAAPTPGPAANDGGPCPGPMLKERTQLLDHIHQAGSHGIGTANYMMAFKGIEDQVAGGATEAQLKPRVDSLNNAIIEQLKRAQVLKTQRPLPPTNSQQADAGPAAAGGGAAPVGGGGGGGLAALGGGKISPDMVSRIKSQLGGIDIPDNLKDQLLKSDKAKELLKKLSQ